MDPHPSSADPQGWWSTICWVAAIAFVLYLVFVVGLRSVFRLCLQLRYGLDVGSPSATFREDNVSLYFSVFNAQKKGRRFYPGAPGWIKRGHKFHHLAPLEDPSVTTEEIASAALKLSVRRESFSKTARQRCSRRDCSSRVPSEDPPECVCGDVYCSDTCHKQDWAIHQKECKASSDEFGNGQIHFTDLYWKMVLKGYFPFKNEPDFVVQWEEKVGGTSDWDTTFYQNTESLFVGDQLGELQEEFREILTSAINHPNVADRRPNTESGKFMARNTQIVVEGLSNQYPVVRAFMNMIYRQRIRYATTFPFDTPGRVEFKKGMTELMQNISQVMDDQCGMTKFLDLPAGMDFTKTGSLVNTKTKIGNKKISAVERAIMAAEQHRPHQGLKAESERKKAGGSMKGEYEID